MIGRAARDRGYKVLKGPLLSLPLCMPLEKKGFSIAKEDRRKEQKDLKIDHLFFIADR